MKKTMNRTINDHLLNPTPIPVELMLDLVDRLSPLNLSEASGWFVHLVGNKIADTGKHVDDLTIREVRAIIEDCRTATNKAAKRKRFWWKYT
ncbi:MAG: hypothetical protein JAY74_17860 [Candidatus Thiodiazotropha taylori]|nr:hypothetical protein [Candidatus Thiodiazotropha taylori]